MENICRHQIEEMISLAAAEHNGIQPKEPLVRLKVNRSTADGMSTFEHFNIHRYFVFAKHVCKRNKFFALELNLLHFFISSRVFNPFSTAFSSFSQSFEGRVANPKDVIVFCQRRPRHLNPYVVTPPPPKPSAPVEVKKEEVTDLGAQQNGVAPVC